MDVREKLVNSEIQHLGQMIQILSYELTILCDFVREKFGASFESYRSKHALSTETVPQSKYSSRPSGSPSRVTARKSTANYVPTTSKRQHDDEAVKSNEERPEAEFMEEDHEDDENEGQELPMNESTFEDEMYEGNLAADEIWTVEGDPGAYNQREKFEFPEGSVVINSEQTFKSRKKKAIWSKFIIARQPNNKIIAKCPRCGHLVSSKVERLEKHYEKCQGGSYRRRPVKSEKTAATSASGNVDVKPLIAEAGAPKAKKRSMDGERERGRRMDQVWSYFEVQANDTMPSWKRKTVKCKRCLKDVSPKVERVRKHFMLCYGILNESQGDGGDDDGGDDDAGDNQQNLDSTSIAESGSESKVPMPISYNDNETIDK